MKIKVFVLVKWGRVQNSETPLMEIVGVYSTKTAAKEKMAEEKEKHQGFLFRGVRGRGNGGIQREQYRELGNPS